MATTSSSSAKKATPVAQTPDVGQSSTGTNAAGETTYNFSPIKIPAKQTTTPTPTVAQQVKAAKTSKNDMIDTSTGLPVGASQPGATGNLYNNGVKSSSSGLSVGTSLSVQKVDGGTITTENGSSSFTPSGGGGNIETNNSGNQNPTFSGTGASTKSESPPTTLENKQTRTAEDNKMDTSTGLPASENKKKIVEPTVAADETQAFATLMAGGKLAPSKDSALWQAHYNGFLALNKKDAKALASSVLAGDIAPRYMDYLNKYNPQKAAEVEKLVNDGESVDSINSASANLYEIFKDGVDEIRTPEGWGNKEKTLTKSQQILQAEIDEFKQETPSYRELRDKYYAGNDKLTESKKKMATMEQDMNDTKDQITKIAEDLRTRYPDVPQSMIIGMAERASYDLNQKLTRQMREYNIEYANYQADKEDLNTELSFDKMMIDEDKQDRKDKMSFLDKLYQTTKSDEDWQRQADFEMQKIKMAQADGDKKAEQQHTWNLQAIQEQQKFTASENALQREQAWKIVQEQMKNSGKSVVEKGADENGDWVNIFDSKNNTYEKKYVNDIVSGAGVTEGTYKPGTNNVSFSTDFDGNTTFKIDGLGQYLYKEDGVTPVECGGFVNRIAGEPSKFGDSYNSKIRNANSQEPKAGDVFVSNIGVKDPNKDYGHCGMVNKVVKDANGNVTGLYITDANAKLDNKIRKDVFISKGDKIFDTITGYYTPQYKQNASKNSMKQLMDKDIANGIGQISSNITRVTGKNEEAIIGNIQQKIMDYGTGSEEVRNAIYNGIAETLSGDDKKNFVATTNLIPTLKNISAQISEFEKLYPNSGGFSNAMQRFADVKKRQLSGQGLTEEQYAIQQLSTSITQQMQNYRRAVTGAAFSVKEMDEYRNLFPVGMWNNVSLDPKISKQRIDMLVKSTEDMLGSEVVKNLGSKQIYNKLMGGSSTNIDNLTTDNQFMTSNAYSKTYGVDDWSQQDWFQNYFNTN